jgi:hypothetical protein
MATKFFFSSGCGVRIRSGNLRNTVTHARDCVTMPGTLRTLVGRLARSFHRSVDWQNHGISERRHCTYYRQAGRRTRLSSSQVQAGSAGRICLRLSGSRLAWARHTLIALPACPEGSSVERLSKSHCRRNSSLTSFVASQETKVVRHCSDESNVASSTQLVRSHL